MSTPRGDQLNVMGPKQLVGSRTNKIPHASSGFDEGVDGDVANELTLDLSDKELLELSQKWESAYKGYFGKIQERQKVNKQYYLGTQNQTQYASTSSAPVSGNILFDATETFLAAALAREPDPVVHADDTPQGEEESRLVRTMLTALADQLVLRRKLAMMVRHWNIYFIGVLKHGWDEDLQEISTEIRKPRNFIFDPEGYVDCYGDFVGYLGEKITQNASQLVELFPDHSRFIQEIAEFKMGTPLTYTEWWEDDYYFVTLKGRVLDKGRNPHFNYPKTVPEKTKDLVKAVLKRGDNHFVRPKKPYTFLSVFSLQEQPHDETSLIEQNIPNQNLITRRIQQIDKNFNHANNSLVFSADQMDAQKASQAAKGIEDGNPVLVNGDVRSALARFPAPSYPAEAFKELEMNINNLRNIYGVQGITATVQNEQTTARGMILNQQRDSSRIGGGIGDALEQVAENVFNWWYQMMKVYYDIPHTASVIGATKSVELATLDMESITRRLFITVANDSMMPKDELTQANQAMQLFEAGALDPKTLLRLQNVPSPEETAEATVLWATNKQAYIQTQFPELMQQLQPPQPQAGGAPGMPPGAVPSPIQPEQQVQPAEPPAPLSTVPLPQLPQ